MAAPSKRLQQLLACTSSSSPAATPIRMCSHCRRKGSGHQQGCSADLPHLPGWPPVPRLWQECRHLCLCTSCCRGQLRAGWLISVVKFKKKSTSRRFPSCLSLISQLLQVEWKGRDLHLALMLIQISRKFKRERSPKLSSWVCWTPWPPHTPAPQMLSRWMRFLSFPALNHLCHHKDEIFNCAHVSYLRGMQQRVFLKLLSDHPQTVWISCVFDVSFK